MVIPRVFVKEVSEYFDYSIGVIRLQYSSNRALILEYFRPDYSSISALVLEYFGLSTAPFPYLIGSNGK